MEIRRIRETMRAIASDQSTAKIEEEAIKTLATTVLEIAEAVEDLQRPS
jgi:hypothetical protein